MTKVRYKPAKDAFENPNTIKCNGVGSCYTPFIGIVSYCWRISFSLRFSLIFFPFTIQDIQRRTMAKNDVLDFGGVRNPG